MAWTTPKTWASEPLTSTDLNEQVRDNLNHLKDRLDTGDEYTADEVSNYSTSSGAFADVDTTNYALTIMTHGGDVLCGFQGDFLDSSGAPNLKLDIEVDGTRHFGDDGIGTKVNGTTDHFIGFVVLIQGLSAGSHTFKLQWAANNGTALLYAGAGSNNADYHPQFWVKEI